MDVRNIKKEMEEELVADILPFWMKRMTDEANGGFYGRITGIGELMPEAAPVLEYSEEVFSCSKNCCV